MTNRRGYNPTTGLACRWVAVAAGNTPEEHSNSGPHVLTNCPVNCHAVLHGTNTGICPRAALLDNLHARHKPATKILICTMTSNNIIKRICALIPAAAVMLRALAFAPSITCADTYVSDFQTSFDGWQQQWHNESETGTPGVVSHSTERGYNDGASLKFDMGDGFGDDGTLWIEKMFSIDAGVPTNIAVAFQQFNEFQSDFNTFQVKAAVSIQNPNEQADFTTIGNTDSGEGWVPFEYDRARCGWGLAYGSLGKAIATTGSTMSPSPRPRFRSLRQ